MHAKLYHMLVSSRPHPFSPSLTVLKSFDSCTQPLGSLKQNLFSCLTCNPPPPSPSGPYEPAGVCYSCSISCHGEHELVELFARRNFTCDCGTNRLPSTSPCTLRADPATGSKGSTHSEAPAQGNTYNQNFRNRFCGCGEIYDAHQQKATMYQCIGLATEENGGCGEDWWHPECLLGLGRGWYEDAKQSEHLRHLLSSVKDDLGERYDELRVARYEADSEHFVPRTFPKEDQIDSLICYKCCNAVPWIKNYAGSSGFFALPKMQHLKSNVTTSDSAAVDSSTTSSITVMREVSLNPLRKRSAEDSDDVGNMSPKRTKLDSASQKKPTESPLNTCTKPPGKFIPTDDFSLIALDEDFRAHLCRCSECYPLIRPYPQLLEEEENYEPSLSSDDENGTGGSVGTKSLLDRGEAALSNVDRVRAIGTFSWHIPSTCLDKSLTVLDP